MALRTGAHRGRSRADPLATHRGGRSLADPRLLLAGMIGLYTAIFGWVTWVQQSNFGTFGYDMGIYDQAIWLLAHGHSFITVRGLSVWGNHVNLILFLFVPFFWLGAGPHFLFLAETVWLALGAMPLYWLARHRLANAWMALIFPAAYLLYPALEWMNWWHFHPEALDTTSLLFAYWFGLRRRWGWFAVAVLATLSSKEDAAFAVFILGVTVAWRWRQRRVGLLTAGVAAAWLVVCTRFVIPHADHGQNPFYVDFFPGLGHNVGQIAKNAVVHPSRIWRPIRMRNRREYYLQLFGPVAFLPIGALPVLLLGGPQLVTNAVSSFGYTYEIHNHYHSLIIAAVFLATVEFVSRWRPPPLRLLLAGALMAASVYGNVHWSPSPLSSVWHNGTWQMQPDPRVIVVNDALASIPASGGVSATYSIVPHVTHRQFAYEWPNPWRQANWGIHDQRPPNPATVNYLVIDRSLIGPDDPTLLTSLIGPGGDFDLVFDRDNIVLAHRRGSALTAGAGVGARFHHPVGDQTRSVELAMTLAFVAAVVVLWWILRREPEARPASEPEAQPA